VFRCAFQRADLPQAGLEDEAFLFALPEEVLVLFGQGAQVEVLRGVQVDQVFGVVLEGLAVGEQAGPEGGPAGVEDLFLGYVGTILAGGYSNTQSSYCSISFMQGVVSKVAGTDAGTLAKYRNDIKLISNSGNKIKVQNGG
jgi:hypothetical protein